MQDFGILNTCEYSKHKIDTPTITKIRAKQLTKNTNDKFTFFGIVLWGRSSQIHSRRNFRNLNTRSTGGNQMFHEKLIKAKLNLVGPVQKLGC